MQSSQPFSIAVYKPVHPCEVHLHQIINVIREHLGKNVHMYQHMSTLFPRFAPLFHIAGHEYVQPCVAPCACPRHLSSSPTSWLEYVHASVHAYMST